MSENNNNIRDLNTKISRFGLENLPNDVKTVNLQVFSFKIRNLILRLKGFNERNGREKGLCVFLERDRVRVRMKG